MRRLLPFLFSAVLLLGCGKAAETEGATGAAVDISINQLTLYRTQPQGGVEVDNLLALVHVENKRSTTVRLTRIEYTTHAGGHAGRTAEKELNESLASGSSTNLKLDTLFAWPNDAELAAKKGRIEGVLTYTTTKSKRVQVPFDIQSDLQIQGE